jgi:O-methyltransferase
MAASRELNAIYNKGIMTNGLVKILRRAVLVLCAPVFLGRFFAKETGSEYGIGFFRKVWLLDRMRRNRFRIVTASGLLDQVVMVTEILRIPRVVEGAVVECGSYQGGSTTNLSLVCGLVGRTLHVFDSFAGLPEPSEADKLHVLPSVQELRGFNKGDFCGTLETVKANVQRFGKLEVCRFHVGYFENTLPEFAEPCVFAFCDVDLRGSLETCVQYLWPRLADRSCLFTHEANHMEIASLFFDTAWWKERLQSVPPGLVGGGSGLGLYVSPQGFFRSSIGFAVKNIKPSDYAASGSVNPRLLSKEPRPVSSESGVAR